MKSILVLLAVLAAAMFIFATEARVESMGSNSDFIRDDVSVFDNPATCFDYGNLLVGALGRVEKQGTSWVRKDEWFGGWAVYPLNPQLKLSLGATLNRPFSVTKQYQSVKNSGFFRVFNSNNRFEMQGQQNQPYVNYLDALAIPDPYGNVYLFAGVNMSNFLSVAVGGRYAGYEKTVGASDISSTSTAGGNLGVVYRFDQHSLEANVNFDNFSLAKKHIYLDDAGGSNSVDISFDESNMNVGMRLFYVLSQKNTIIPVVLLDKSELLGIKKTDLGAGVGFSRSLYKGFIWTGMKYVYHSATYPEKIGGEYIYSGSTKTLPAGIEETSHKLVYSFGVEKKMLWDWFTLRVGANKVFEYLTKKRENGDLYQKSLEERDVDAVAWGIALGTPDDRLMFDVTVSEEFPYSNFLAGGEDGVMVYRIAAALKF